MSVFDPDAMIAPLTTRAESLSAASDAPAVLVASYRDGRYAEAAAGVSDLQSGVAAEPGQTFEIGSQSKLITAVVVLQLVAEGKVDLDAPASDWLPASVTNGIANAGTATVRQLLQMRSGVPSYTEAVDGNGEPLYLKALRTHPDEPFGPDEALDVARDMPATNAPGADYHYSNTGYLLLGLLIEEVTGKSWARNLEERVFDPVGMHDTTARQFAPDPHRLSSYQERDGELVDVTDGLWVPRGESGVVSTTADMIAFLEALVVDRTLLTPEMYEAMTDFRPTGGGGFTHGLGLWQIPVGGRMVIGRGGGTLGTSSGTWYDPASGTFVAMAATTDAADTNAVSRAFGATINASAAWSRVNDGDPLDVRDAAAADLTVTALRGATRLAVGDASIELDRALRATSTANTRFDDGSVLVVGDDSSATTADDNANDVRIARDHASAMGRDNHLIGLGGDDRLTGGNGNDRIDGGTGADRLGGTGGNDVLVGWRGDDRLVGGDGRDRLTGGAGHDAFVFQAGASVPGSADVILDFDPKRDVIDLRPIDAVPGGGDSDFDWIGRSGFDGEAGQLRYARAGDDLRVRVDIDGDGRADLVIALHDLGGLSAGHFLL